MDFALPDSITTWVVQAIGVSREDGLCVAPPLNITTFRSSFVHVDLPYVSVRLEQLEVRATACKHVYNYMVRPISVSKQDIAKQTDSTQIPLPVTSLVSSFYD